MCIVSSRCPVVIAAGDFSKQWLGWHPESYLPGIKPRSNPQWLGLIHSDSTSAMKKSWVVCVKCTWLKHLGTVFLPLTIRSHEAADLIGLALTVQGEVFEPSESSTTPEIAEKSAKCEDEENHCHDLIANPEDEAVNNLKPEALEGAKATTEMAGGVGSGWDYGMKMVTFLWGPMSRKHVLLPHQCHTCCHICTLLLPHSNPLAATLAATYAPSCCHIQTLLLPHLLPHANPHAATLVFVFILVLFGLVCFLLFVCLFCFLLFCLFVCLFVSLFLCLFLWWGTDQEPRPACNM